MKRVILLSSTTLIILTGILFYFIIFGVPIHDARIWILKRVYSRVEHPISSMVRKQAFHFLAIYAVMTKINFEISL